jgi:hypothetical protein
MGATIRPLGGCGTWSSFGGARTESASAGHLARAVAVMRFSWSSITSTMAEVIAEVVASPRSAPQEVSEAEAQHP